MIFLLYLADHVNIGKGRSHIMSSIEFTISVEFCNKSSMFQWSKFPIVVMNSTKTQIFFNHKVFSDESKFIWNLWAQDTLHEIYKGAKVQGGHYLVSESWVKKQCKSHNCLYCALKIFIFKRTFLLAWIRLKTS